MTGQRDKTTAIVAARLALLGRMTRDQITSAPRMRRVYILSALMLALKDDLLITRTNEQFNLPHNLRVMLIILMVNKPNEKWLERTVAGFMDQKLYFVGDNSYVLIPPPAIVELVNELGKDARANSLRTLRPNYP